jgi:antitoxin VapB
MPVRAKLFKNGGSQAVRLPKGFRFEGAREVLVHREGRRIVLEPADEWPREFRASLGKWRKSIERPPQVPIRKARDPFA